MGSVVRVTSVLFLLGLLVGQGQETKYKQGKTKKRKTNDLRCVEANKGYKETVDVSDSTIAPQELW